MKGLKGVKQNFKRVGMSKGGIKYKGGDQTPLPTMASYKFHVVQRCI